MGERASEEASKEMQELVGNGLNMHFLKGKPFTAGILH